MHRPFEVEKYNDHDLWNDTGLQHDLAHLALVASSWMGSRNKVEVNLKYTELYRAVAEYGSGYCSVDIYKNNLINGEKDANKQTESFYQFLRHKTGRMNDAIFLDILSQYLILRKEGCFEYGVNRKRYSWDKILKGFKRHVKLIERVESFADNIEFAGRHNDSSQTVDDLCRIAGKYFGVKREQFKSASKLLTGITRIKGAKAGPGEKGYWACYRLSGSEVGKVIKTRLVVTPPEIDVPLPDTGYAYCRFQNYSGSSSFGTRDAQGLVLPVKGWIYMLGAFERGLGAKIICLKEPLTGAHLTNGLLMTLGLSGDTKPVISRLVAIRENKKDAIELNNEEVITSRKNLGEFDLVEDTKKMLPESYNNSDENVLLDSLSTLLLSGLRNCGTDIELDDAQRALLDRAISIWQG